jgi:predicted metal-dependent phosphoesterase TrpH
MKIRLEVHTHTKYSHDSSLNKWLYLFMLKIRKINTIAITDHNEISGAIEFKDFLERYGINVIIGEEIFTNKGEVIGLFLSQKIEPGKSVRDTILEIKKQGGIVYIPHPYDEKRYKTVLPEEEIKNNIDLIDIIEIHNGRNICSYFSDHQLSIANKYPSALKLVGSDAHTFIELGRNYNIIEQFNTPEEFISNLKTVFFVKKDCIKFAHEITRIVRFIKLLRKGDFNELQRIINRKLGKN